MLAKHAKVLLINPTYEAFNWAPHIGLGYLASYLKKNGHFVKIIDGLKSRFNGIDFHDFWKANGPYDIVGITSLISSYAKSIDMAREAKKYNTIVVLGGPHAAWMPEKSLKDSGADFVLRGEGEIGLSMLADGKDRGTIPGLMWLENGALQLGAPSVFHENLDDFGQPDWEQIKPADYQHSPHGFVTMESPIAPVITTRGCPYDCSFCSASIIAGKKIRYRSPALIVDEISRLVNEFSVREIQISDDNFTFNRQHAISVCEEILNRGIDVPWSLPNGIRLDKIDKELLAIMKKSGCYSTSVGIESGTQRILEMVGKHLRVDIVAERVNLISEAGIAVNGFFMLGFPTETKDEMLRTIELALSLPLDRASFSRVTPLPGTRMFADWIKTAGAEMNIDSLYDETTNLFNFNTCWSDVDIVEIRRLTKYAMFRFYSRPRVFLNTLKMVKPRQFKYFVKRLLTLFS